MHKTVERRKGDRTEALFSFELKRSHIIDLCFMVTNFQLVKVITEDDHAERQHMLQPFAALRLGMGLLSMDCAASLRRRLN